MHPSFVIRRVIPVLLVCVVVASVAAQSQPDRAKNLKVLPQDISHQDLIVIMNGFTRALGVRCIYCHVGEEGKPFQPGSFALDDKPTKAKARVMMQMMADINQKYLPTLETRENPPISVQCVTCHRGTTQPRMLQDVLKTAYDQGGMDSTLARYHALRDRYYGRFTYDFGEVPLAELARSLQHDGHDADAAQVLALNVDMNPNSPFAKRMQATSAIRLSYATSGADSGAAMYQTLKARYGPKVVSEDALNEVGYGLLGSGKTDAAIAAFKLNVDENPKSGNAYDSLGEAYATKGDKKLAIQSYSKSLELDPTNENAKHELEVLKGSAKNSKKKG